MTVLVTNCPHCGATNSTFRVVSALPHRSRAATFNVVADCPACGEPILAIVASGNSPMAYDGNLAEASGRGIFIYGMYPDPFSSECPESVPIEAAEAFDEGTASLANGQRTAAVAMFRRSLELALKAFSPEIEAWKLEKRIDKLEAAGAITKDMKIWAHKIRLEGNDAVHEVARPSLEAVQELHLFTEMILTYLYTLPAKVKSHLPEQV